MTKEKAEGRGNKPNGGAERAAPGFVEQDPAGTSGDPVSLDTMDEYLLGTVDISLGSEELDLTHPISFSNVELETRLPATKKLRPAKAVVVSNVQGLTPVARCPVTPAEEEVSQIGPSSPPPRAEDSGLWGEDMETMPIPPEELERFRRRKE